MQLHFTLVTKNVKIMQRKSESSTHKIVLQPGHFNPLTTNLPNHIDTSQLICSKSIDWLLYDGEHWSLMG